MKINIENLKANLTSSVTTSDYGLLREIVYSYMKDIGTCDLTEIKNTISYKTLLELNIIEEN